MKLSEAIAYKTILYIFFLVKGEPLKKSRTVGVNGSQMR